MAEASPEKSLGQRGDGGLVSPQSIYRKRQNRPIVSQVQRIRTSISPMSSRGQRSNLRYSAKDQSPSKIETGRYMSPLYSGKWDLSLSMIEERRSPKKRHSRRFPTAIEEGMLTVKGMAPAVYLSTFSPLLLSSVIMRKSLLPPRISTFTPLTKKTSQAPTTRPKRYSTASPQKRRTIRPKTSQLNWDSPTLLKSEENFDDVAAWD